MPACLFAPLAYLRVERREWRSVAVKCLKQCLALLSTRSMKGMEDSLPLSD